MTMNDLPLARRVEEACLNGWPALKSVVHDGWQLRFSWGHTKRANSVSLLGTSSLDIEAKVRFCERLYERHKLPPIFRLSTQSAETIDPVLDRLGYASGAEETLVLYKDLKRVSPSAKDTSLVLRTEPATAWLGAMAGIQGLSGNVRMVSQAIFEAIALPTCFVSSLAPNGRTAAVAYGAVQDGIVCINAVATDAAFRRQGHARRVIETICAWMVDEQNAIGACVPVVATNANAIELYRSLGFATEISRYAYRRKD
jgi:ribosomal protein S18 acetylase RimI-like enzyme